MRSSSLQDLFLRHPIRFPLILALLGFGLFGWQLFSVRVNGYLFPLSMGFTALCGIVGVVLLPIGVLVVLRRHRNPVMLRCPRCGTEGRTAQRPFRVDRWGDVPYAVVYCSVCGADFTVDRNAVLV